MKKSKLKALKGKKVVDYNGDKGKVIKSATFKEQNKLVKYDTSGWLEKNSHKELGLKKKDVLVAVEYKDGSTEVFTLGNGGVELSKKQDKPKTD